VRAPEQAAQDVMQAVPRVGQRIDPVHRRPGRRRQPAGLLVIDGAPDITQGDLLNHIRVDEAQAISGGDDDPVEYIEFGYFQHVLEAADRRASAAQHRRSADCRLIRDSRIVSHAGILSGHQAAH